MVVLVVSCIGENVNEVLWIGFGECGSGNVS